MVECFMELFGTSGVVEGFMELNVLFGALCIVEDFMEVNVQFCSPHVVESFMDVNVLFSVPLVVEEINVFFGGVEFMVLFGLHVEEFIVLFSSHVEEFVVPFGSHVEEFFGSHVVLFGSHVEKFLEGTPGVVVGITVLFGARSVLLSKTKHVGDTVVVAVRTAPIELFVNSVIKNNTL